MTGVLLIPLKKDHHKISLPKGSDQYYCYILINFLPEGQNPFFGQLKGIFLCRVDSLIHQNQIL